MAKKKIKTCDDEVITMQSIFTRIGLSGFEYVNNTIYALDKNNNTYYINVGPILMGVYMEHDEFTNIKELHIHSEQNKYIEYVTNVDDWLEIPLSDEIIKGGIYQISIDCVDFDIPINRDIFPVKMRKAESNNLYYKVYKTEDNILLIIKKVFKSTIDGCDFEICRIFKVIQ